MYFLNNLHLVVLSASFWWVVINTRPRHPWFSLKTESCLVVFKFNILCLNPKNSVITGLCHHSQYLNHLESQSHWKLSLTPEPHIVRREKGLLKFALQLPWKSVRVPLPALPIHTKYKCNLKKSKLDMVVKTYNSSTWEMKAGRSLWESLTALDSGPV